MLAVLMLARYTRNFHYICRLTRATDLIHLDEQTPLVTLTSCVFRRDAVLEVGSRFSGSRPVAGWRLPLMTVDCCRRWSTSRVSWQTVDIYDQHVDDAAVYRDAVCDVTDDLPCLMSVRRRCSNCPPADVVPVCWTRRTSVARRQTGTSCSDRQSVVLGIYTSRHDLTTSHITTAAALHHQYQSE